jgi:RNA polymerase sigma-70 factor (ECF subfamily)
MAYPEAEAVRRLVETHWSGLVLFARQWTEDPEDVVQDAFVRRFQQIRAPADEVAWLFRVVRNEAISRSRRRRNRSAREARVAVHEPWFEPMDDQLDAHEATRALQELDTDLREVVVMRLWGQATLQQIADVLNISVATAHRRYERALEILRGRLEPRLVEQPNDDTPRNTA